MDRRQFCAGIVAAALPLASARAQTWPDKPVNIILSQPPGSGPDNIARLLADRLGHMWGKVVVILNKPGGQNIIGAQAAAGPRPMATPSTSPPRPPWSRTSICSSSCPTIR